MVSFFWGNLDDVPKAVDLVVFCLDGFRRRQAVRCLSFWMNFFWGWKSCCDRSLSRKQQNYDFELFVSLSGGSLSLWFCS